jgi:NAD(P)-dependent dehydrogenase (short-subunit alcohol dehydrogenase family)
VADLNATEALVPQTSFVELDVTSWKSLVSLFKDTYEKYGRIDVVFANAGVARTDNYLDTKLDTNGDLVEPTHRTIDINLKACINTVVLAIHYMKQQKEGGSIIVTASASSYQKFIASDYATAKHGVLGLMRSLVDQLSPHLIRINAIAPSWTDTRLVPKAALASIGVPVQSTEVVAKSVAILAVDEKRHGQTIYSSNGVYKETEEPILKATKEILDEEIDEGEAVILLAASRNLDQLTEKAKKQKDAVDPS